MPHSEIDYLIVGQGLAGSLLAFELLARQKKVLVLDNQHIGSSSVVAAGIINPITGHRLNLTEGFENYLLEAKRCYTAIEASLDNTFIFPLEQHRLIKNSGQARYLQKRLSQLEYEAFLESDNRTKFKKNEYGSVNIKQTYLLDTKQLLSDMHAYLLSSSSYLAKRVNYQQISFQKDAVYMEGVSAKQVIFCEGYQAINNPWLQDLPFKLSKGEILSLNTAPPGDCMLNWGNWLIPSTRSQSRCKLGSSYAWNDIDLKPSTAIRDKLLLSLSQNIETPPVKVVKHEIGIRPTTKCRQAFVGPISNLENAYCFNGFGSKGCLTIPAHAQLLCDHLISGKNLPSELTQWL